MVASLITKKLTPAGALLGGLVAMGLYAGCGFTGIALLGTFFFLGIAATRYKQEWKEAEGISKERERMRTAGQVFANGGLAGMLGSLVVLFPQHAALLQTMIAACLASATADTISSELGVVYGRRFYNIRNLKRDARGLDGVISLEGTVLGLCGSIVVALVYAIGFGINTNIIWIIVAGTLGNLADSLLGATLERRHLLGNNAVNFFNTACAAFAAAALFSLA